MPENKCSENNGTTMQSQKINDLVDLCLNCCAIWQLLFDIDVIIAIVPLFCIAFIIFACKDDAKD